MDKQYLAQLARAVYRVTELFPRNEPLRYKTREMADEILHDFVLFQNLEAQKRNQAKNQIFSKIEILSEYYFDLAKEQNWVNPRNFLILKREYDKIKTEMVGAPSSAQFEPSEVELPKIEPKPEHEPAPERAPTPTPARIATRSVVGGRSVAGGPQPAPAPTPLPKVPEPEPGKLSERHKEIIKIIKQKQEAQVGEIRESFPELSKRTLRRDLEYLLKQGYVERFGQWNQVSYRVRTQ
ncbi:DeoR family transcriptional regulator [Candidatus Parcubacteria bacterium]|nr:DeoR family transcriptional regulator [Candidatus Parcubacteria bacterium]